MQQAAAPACLSRPAVELIQDHLGKGIVSCLARTGWRRERFLREGVVAEGRLWERTPPQQLGLSFSRHALDFLLWIMTAEAKSGKPSWHPLEAELTVGDRFLFFLALQCLQGFDSGKALRRHPVLQRDGFIRLAFPDRIQDADVAVDWAPWTSGIGASILEALQITLADRWIAIEQSKRRTGDPAAIRFLGNCQKAVLSSFSAAVAAAGRRDLARFLLRALASLLHDASGTKGWLGNLNLDGLRSLAERQAVQRAWLAFPLHLEIFRQWEVEARSVGYFDEGYAAAQVWKAEWEALDGADLHRQAQALLREADPLQ